MKKEPIEDKIAEALKTEIDFQLPDDFTNRMMRKLKEVPIRTDKNLFWIMGISGLFLTLCALVTVALYWEAFAIKTVLSNGIWVIANVAMIGLIQFLDRKLVKDKLKLPVSMQ